MTNKQLKKEVLIYFKYSIRNSTISGGGDHHFTMKAMKDALTMKAMKDALTIADLEEIREKIRGLIIEEHKVHSGDVIIIICNIMYLDK